MTILTNELPHLSCRSLVNFILRKVRIYFADDDAIVYGRPFNRDIALPHIDTDFFGGAFKRVTQPATASRRPRQNVTGFDRHTGKERPEIALILGSWIDPNAVRDGRQPAPKPPGNGAFTITAIGHHGALRLGQCHAFFDAHAAARRAGAARIDDQFMLGGDHGCETFLALERLCSELNAEHRPGCGPAVFSVASTPTADHPVIPHEVWTALLAAIAPANQEILQIKRAGHRPLGQDFRP